MKCSKKPARLAVAALALFSAISLAACGDKPAEDPAATESAAPTISVKAGDAAVETTDTGTVVRAGDVSVSISNSK